MSRDAFRFIHATCLNLDEPLIGTGPLSGPDRELAEDSTFLAWEGIVQTCLDAQVDFLVLTGNSFDDRTQSLRARVALEKGFDRLAENDISVFIAPGPMDPVDAWKRKITLPQNVTLITDEEQEPVAILRDGRVIASVFMVASADSDETRWSASGPAAMNQHQAPFRIGLVPAGTPITWREGQLEPTSGPGISKAAATLVKSAIEHQIEYLALGNGTPRTERYSAGMAHDPGPAQALSRAITGSTGCTVVNVSSAGEIRLDDIAVAPIRFEVCALDVERHCNREDLIERMALFVLDREADNDERLWIMNWRLKGEGKLFESLADQSTRDEFWQLVEAELDGERDIRRLHRIELLNKRQADPERPETATGLIHDFHEILDGSAESLVELVKRDALEQPWLAADNAHVVRDCLEQLRMRPLIRHAKSIAAAWLD